MTDFILIKFQGKITPVSKRDTQRSKVYKAEDVLSTVPQRAYPTVADLERRVREILGSSTVDKLRAEFGLGSKGSVDVHDGRGHRRAVSYGGTIAMPKWARNDRVLLHELAHEIAPRGVHHQWPFAYVYLKLVSRFMGVEAAKALKASFRKHKVRFAPKRERKLSPEQKEAARERLAAARAKKKEIFIGVDLATGTDRTVRAEIFPSPESIG